MLKANFIYNLCKTAFILTGMKNTATTLQDFLAMFDPDAGKTIPKVRDGSPITNWIPTDVKRIYDQLQKSSGNRMSKVLRELQIAAIVEAGVKAGLCSR